VFILKYILYSTSGTLYCSHSELINSEFINFVDSRSHCAVYQCLKAAAYTDNTNTEEYQCLE
jgi:hypothetical protein